MQGIFPDPLKIAKIIPVFKSGDKLKVSNYRPISILSPFSKLLEKIVYTRLTTFVQHNDLLADTQYGFRKNLSTELALIDLTNQISKSLDDHQTTIGIFLDLSKAFDTVNHEILLHKLEHYGIRGTPLKWFTSYLSNRYQYVSLNNTSSSFLPIICGVPQGSILGPLLFLLYVNDIQSVTDLNLIMFADDTNIFATGHCPILLAASLNSKLEEICHWFAANLLSLNLQKTCFMVFTRKMFSDTDVNITINGVSLNRVHEIKFLGVVFSDDLKWKKHVDMVVNKVSKIVGILYRVGHILDADKLKLLYHTLLEPHLTYCCSVWSSPHKTGNLDRILRLQKAAVRIITCSSYLSHSNPLFYKLKILKIYELSHLSKLVFMFKSVHNLLPNQFCNYFMTVDQTHSYNTRTASNYVVPYARTASRAHNLQVLGPRLWNSLSDDLKREFFLPAFKREVKSGFLLKYTEC